jgi:uncharacterized protein YlxW (UPF0749 family)
MRRLSGFTAWLRPLACAVCLLIAVETATAAYDSYLYDSLQRSRDALLGQKDELQRARNDALSQIDRLNQKVQRIDAYMLQIDNSLRDVNDSLNRVH